MGGFNPLYNPALVERYPQIYMSMGETAENVAERFGVSRERAGGVRAGEPAKAAAAVAAGPAGGRDRPDRRAWRADGCPRPDTTLEGAGGARSPRSYAAGTVTAGTSSPLTDGAAAVLVTSEEFAESAAWTPLARGAVDRRLRLRPGDDGHRPGRRQPQGAGAGRDRAPPTSTWSS